MLNKLYYRIKPLIPRSLQLRLRRMLVAANLKKFSGIWPILPGSEKKPEWFKGWPDGKKFAFVVTHDVEKAGGLEKLDQLIAIDKKYGIRSSFGLVPERYTIPDGTVEKIRAAGMEVYVHDLNHDGKLFSGYKLFHERAIKINSYLKQWAATGFRAGAMHHNLDWIGELDIQYDMSTFDTDPFEPMPDGMKTIFPFMAQSRLTGRKYVEIPYTLPQDLMAFIIHPDRSIALWKEKVDWIAEQGGMVLVNVHPDYMAFSGGQRKLDTYPIDKYEAFLEYVFAKYGDKFWNPIAGELNDFVNC